MFGIKKLHITLRTALQSTTERIDLSDNRLKLLEQEFNAFKDNIRVEIERKDTDERNRLDNIQKDITNKIGIISDELKNYKLNANLDITDIKEKIKVLDETLPSIKKDLLDKIKELQDTFTIAQSNSLKKIEFIQGFLDKLTLEDKKLSDLILQNNTDIKERLVKIDALRNDTENNIKLSKIDTDNKVNNLKENSVRLNNEFINLSNIQKADIAKIAGIEKEVSIIQEIIPDVTKNINNIKIPDIKGEINKLDIDNKLAVVKEGSKKELLNSVEARLNLFNQEINKRYYDILAKLIDFNKNFIVAKDTIRVVTKEEYDKLKEKFEKELLEAKWVKSELQNGEKIALKGRNIILKRKEIYDEMLKRERKGEKIEKLKIQLDTYDEIIGGLS